MVNQQELFVRGESFNPDRCFYRLHKFTFNYVDDVQFGSYFF